MAHFFLLWLIFIDKFFQIKNNKNHIRCRRCLLLLKLLRRINLNALRGGGLHDYYSLLDVVHSDRLLGKLGGESDCCLLVGRRGRVFADLISFRAHTVFISHLSGRCHLR
jgi:hypothetical protein